MSASQGGISLIYNGGTVPPQSGGSFLGKVKSVARSLRRSNVISNVAHALDKEGVPYAGSVGRVAESIGYGKKRKSHKGAGKKHNKRK